MLLTTLPYLMVRETVTVTYSLQLTNDKNAGACGGKKRLLSITSIVIWPIRALL